MTSDSRVPSETLNMLLDRLENEYSFECEAGPLKNCVDWMKLRAQLAQASDIHPHHQCEAVELLVEWLHTELDPQDEEYEAWMDSFTKRVDAFIGGEQPDAQAGKFVPMTDEQMLSRIINECDTLDITRVSEMKNGKWHTTTIFDGDAALLRTFKNAMPAAAPESKGKAK